MYKFLWIAAGGAIGAILRYLFVGYICRTLVGDFPWGTLLVNIIGCLVIDILWAITNRFPFSLQIDVFLFTGVLGAFTAFSTYGLESIKLLQQGEIVLGLTYIAVSNMVGLLAVLLGKGTIDGLLTALNL